MGTSFPFPVAGQPSAWVLVRCPSLELIHADPWLLALLKPSGLLSQPGLGPELADSLISRAQRCWPEARLVHRLDRDTSGLILLARDAGTHRALSAAFAERRVHKTYLAWAAGVPAVRGGVIDLPLARVGTRPPRYGVVQADQGSKPALTRWRLLRAHLAALGHPVLGDPIYGDGAAAERLQLHAARLRLRHPVSGAALRLRAPLHGERRAPGLDLFN